MSVQTVRNYMSVQTVRNYMSVQTVRNYMSVQTVRNYMSVQTVRNYMSVQNHLRSAGSSDLALLKDVQSSSGAHTASCTVVIGVNRAQREAEHLLSCSLQVENKWRDTSASHTRLWCDRGKYTSLYTSLDSQIMLIIIFSAVRGAAQLCNVPLVMTSGSRPKIIIT
jgi:hypothetical protein